MLLNFASSLRSLFDLQVIFFHKATKTLIVGDWIENIGEGHSTGLFSCVLGCFIPPQPAMSPGECVTAFHFSCLRYVEVRMHFSLVDYMFVQNIRGTQ